jgi:hypothetical protein
MDNKASGIVLKAISGEEVSALIIPEHGRYLGLDLDLEVAHLGLHSSPKESNTEMCVSDLPNSGSFIATKPVYSDIGKRSSTTT